MITFKTSDKILPAFHDFWRVCNSEKFLYKVLKGGRNSSKSTHISIRIIFDMMNKKINTLVVRKVANTLETSVFEQLLWAIEYLDVGLFWHIKKSPLELVYIPVGNRILFRGADDPMKIKSIKTSKFPITTLWIEELAEFKNEEEVDTIVNSIIRAELIDLKYSIFFCYNPPKRKASWVNKKYNTQFPQKNTYVNHSTYIDNKYVSKAFIEDAETVKARNINKYKWIYLGDAIGGGIVPFQNLVFREITDKEIESFDNIRMGIDWGYASDPFAFIRLHYDKKKRIIYYINEIFQVKLSNREASQRIFKKKYHGKIFADCAEPKSIDEFREYGHFIAGAKKGAGSVEYGEKWLDDLNEIVIDYRRTPNVAEEYENIDYQTDRDGDIKPKLEDKNNHGIDASRYSLSEDMDNKQGIYFT